MRTAWEIINILVVAYKTKVRRKDQEEQKTNSYMEYITDCHWCATVLIFILLFWKEKKMFERVCVCAHPYWMLRDIILF